MKRIGKTLKTKLFVDYQHKGVFFTVHDCRNPAVYVSPGFYLVGPRLNQHCRYASLASAKNAAKRQIEKINSTAYRKL